MTILESKKDQGMPLLKFKPTIATIGANTTWFVFSNISVPTHLVLSIRKNGNANYFGKGEAVLTLQGVGGEHTQEYPTGDLYEDLQKDMFK